MRKKFFHHEEKEFLELIKNDQDYSKLRTYRLFKKKLRLEEYLLVTSNSYGRSIHTSLRSGSNKLEIDMGRRLNLDKKERLCKNCSTGSVEDELHFLIQCPNYNNLRNELYNKISKVSKNKWKLTNLSNNDAFLILMNGSQDEYQRKIFVILHSYLVKCYKIRLKDKQ